MNTAAAAAPQDLDLDELLKRLRAAGADTSSVLGAASDAGDAPMVDVSRLPPELLTNGQASSSIPASILGGVPATPQPTTGYGLLGGDAGSALLGSPQGAPPPPPSPDVAPTRADVPPPAANAPAGPSALPTWGHRNFLGDLADNLFLGGAIQRTRSAERARSIADYQAERMQQVWEGLSPDQRAAFAANPKEFGKALADNFATHTLAGGTTLVPGAGGRFPTITAPLLTNDNGRFVTQRPEGTTITGFSGPKVGPDGMDERTGRQFPKASTAVVPWGSTVQGVTQAGNAAAAFPDIGGNGLAELQGAAAGPGSTGGAQGDSRRALPNLPLSVGGGRSTPSGAQSPLARGGSTAAAIRSTARSAGLSDADGTALVAIARQESSLNPYGPNNGSSTGLFQFHPDTFRAAGGTDIHDPQQQIAAAVNLYSQNRKALSSTLGRAPSTTELYLAHQQGIAGAKALLTSDPSARAVDVLTPTYGGNARLALKAVTGNAGSENATVAQFLNGWGQRMQRQVAAAGRIHDSGAPARSASAPDVQIGPAGFSGFSVTGAPEGQRGPHLLDPGDPRMKGFAPGAVVEDDGIGHLKPMEGTGYTPAALSEIYTRNNKDLAEYTDVVPLVRALRKSYGDNTAAADLSMVEAAARVFNPKATVRQGVMKAFDDTNGVPDAIVGALSQLRGGGANARLSPQTRRAIVQQAEERAAILRRSAQPIIDAQTAFAKRHGIALGDILPPVEELEASPLAGAKGSAPPVRLDNRNPQAAFAALPSGALFIGPDGRTRRKP